MKKYKLQAKFYFVVTMLSLIAVGTLVNLYEQYYPFRVIEIHSPLKIKNPTVKAGGVIIYIGDYCLYKSYPATVSRTLVDGTVIQLPLVNGLGELGCHTINVQVPIPEGAMPGTYHLEGLSRYQVTPTRFVDYRFYTQSFTITK